MLAITAHTAFGSQQAESQPRRAVKAADRGNRFVQAAAILPVVTGESGSRACPRRGAAGQAGLLEDLLCLDGIGVCGRKER